MSRPYEQIITLSAARGGWQGIIIEVLGTGSYLVQPLDYYNNTDSGRVIVREADIDSGHTNYPSFSVGETVNLAGFTGEVKGQAGTVYTVEVDDPQLHYTQTRSHDVPRWQLLSYNSEKLN